MERAVLPKVIETDRLTLRPWALTDADDVYAYASDPEWARFLRVLPRPYERGHADEFVARQILLDRVTHPAWAITLDGTPIGGINLRFAFEHRQAEMGYSVARVHWGKGFCTEAARALIDAAFRTHADLNRLKARADVENTASHRVMEKCGMQREGVLRQDRVERGEAVDEVWYGILRSEWEGVSDAGGTSVPGDLAVGSAEAETAAALRAEADALLASGLGDALASYGEVHPVGSYRMGLMSWRDLDIQLVREPSDPAAFFALGTRLAELLAPHRMNYRDERASAAPGLPNGLYWGVHLGDERRGAWKIDVWATGPKGLERVHAYCDAIERRLTPATRAAILRIKAACWGLPEYRHVFSSEHVYSAVLEHGVEDVEGFRAWLETSPP